MKRRLFSLAAAGLVAAPLAGLSGAVVARTLPPPPRHQIGALAAVSVIDRNSGRELPVYLHRGEYWIAGTAGARYAIRVRNASGERVMTVISVDGINVVSGETAGFDQNGYVLAAHERTDIAGWRKSDAQIAAFEFATPGEAYASRTGRPDHLGVIGIAVFRERAELRTPPPVYRSEDRLKSERRSAPAADAAAESSANAGASASAKAASPAPSLGTGHGQRETSHVGRTRFERAQTTPDEIVRIRYDSRENLVAAGVIPPVRWPRPAEPSPFPASNVGYVPDPPRY